ncbi:hypothetical protein RPALISO_95 [Ruegeria phage RpAliso]|nr:hypothetical protein RPALISO_95 [Ruegeria phage RpAliso]
MAHYECSDCGAYEGIGFGYCRSCTPPEYRELTKARKQVIDRANLVASRKFAKRRLALDEEERAFAKALYEGAVAPLDERIHELKYAGDRSYRYKWDREKANE